MFKKKYVFSVIDSNVIDFCRVLGKYGLKFQIGKLHTIVNTNNPFETCHYRSIAVHASNRQAKKLYNEFSDEYDF